MLVHLKEKRQQARFSVKAIADVLGCVPHTVRNHEAGKGSPTIQQLETLIQFYADHGFEWGLADFYTIGQVNDDG